MNYNDLLKNCKHASGEIYQTNWFCKFVACKFVIVFWGTGQHYLPPPLQDHPQTKGFCKNVVLQFGRSRYILLHARPVVLRSGLSLVSRSGDSAPGPKETEDAERARETGTERLAQQALAIICARVSRVILAPPPRPPGRNKAFYFHNVHPF